MKQKVVRVGSLKSELMRLAEVAKDAVDQIDSIIGAEMQGKD